MTEDKTYAKAELLPIVPFTGYHPQMLIKTPERDRRLDVVTESEYTQNTEAYD